MKLLEAERGTCPSAYSWRSHCGQIRVQLSDVISLKNKTDVRRYESTFNIVSILNTLLYIIATLSIYLLTHGQTVTKRL